MGSTGGLIFLGIGFAMIAFWIIGSYNSLIRLKAQMQRCWSNIDVILKQRHDEIPQLIQVVEQFTSYESGILTKLIEARKSYGSAQSVGEKIKASQEVTFALGGIMALGEAYPQLKSNENFQQLQMRVSSLESSIADRRESYNEAVTNFNTRIEQYPDLFLARMLNYQGQELFQVAEAEKVAPSLKMNLPKVS